VLQTPITEPVSPGSKGLRPVYPLLTAAALAAAISGHHGTVTVQPGQTLSELALTHCGTAADYPGLARASGISNPDMVGVGQRVVINCSTVGPRSHWGQAPAATTTASYTGRHRTASGGHYKGWRAPDGRVWMVTYGFPFKCGDGTGDGYDTDCAEVFPERYGHHTHGGYQQAAEPTYTGRHRHHRHRYASGGGGTYRGSSGCEAHIIGNESGGDPHAVNSSSGAGGLFQFLPSTWHSLGHSGLPQNASVAEQRQAYHQQVAQSGYSAWAASGGCG
jgi:transglycosylase-like protein